MVFFQRRKEGIHAILGFKYENNASLVTSGLELAEHYLALFDENAAGNLIQERNSSSCRKSFKIKVSDLISSANCWRSFLPKVHANSQLRTRKNTNARRCVRSNLPCNKLLLVNDKRNLVSR